MDWGGNLRTYRTQWQLIPRLGVFRGIHGLLLPFFMQSLLMLLVTITLAFSQLLVAQADRWQQGVVGRLMIEVPAVAEMASTQYRLHDRLYRPEDVELKDAIQHLQASLMELDNITHAQWIAPPQLQDLLASLLGETPLDQDITLPLLIDVSIAEGADVPLAKLHALLQQYAPDARLEDHGVWRERVMSTTTSLAYVANGFSVMLLVMMLLLAMVITEGECLRARTTIAVMSMLGATPLLLVFLMIRRMARVIVRASLLSLALSVGLYMLSKPLLDKDFQQMIDFAQLFAQPSWWIWLMVYYVGVSVAMLLLTAWRTRQYLRIHQ